MKTWNNHIIAYLENDQYRQLIGAIPIHLLASMEYIPNIDYWYSYISKSIN